MARNTPETFWSRVDHRGPNECWEWLWHKMPSGYGKFRMNKRDYTAHALAWSLANNQDAPSGNKLVILHSCNNKLCCNPYHLSLGTRSENAYQAYKDGLCVTGDRHHKSRLTCEQVAKIRGDNRKHKDIADDYGVGRTCITRIKNGTRRKYEDHING